MEALTIDAASQDSARSMLDALTDFEPQLVETVDGGFQVVVGLAGSDRRIVEVLNALERYVTERDDGPARVEFEGHAYTIHPEPSDGA
jgi:hypothetical protein